ncbi:MAG: UvrD-helicase domain-containing protein, partial [Anaerolineaceae bacterium]
MILRPAQQAILQYQYGRMAVSAVPGSGKTFTLALLAAQLVAAGYNTDNQTLDPDNDQHVMIVTYLNASVDTFKARIRKRLEEMDLPPDLGYEVRTLHSLALEIVRLSESGLGAANHDPAVLDQTQSSHFLAAALDGWIEANPHLWHAFLSNDSPRERALWRKISEDTAHSFIRSAKNNRYQPYEILTQLAEQAAQENGYEQPDLSFSNSPLLHMMTGIYGRYQSILTHQG